jgi:hypothetical protein
MLASRSWTSLLASVSSESARASKLVGEHAGQHVVAVRVPTGATVGLPALTDRADGLVGLPF